MATQIKNKERILSEKSKLRNKNYLWYSTIFVKLKEANLNIVFGETYVCDKAFFLKRKGKNAGWGLDNRTGKWYINNITMLIVFLKMGGSSKHLWSFIICKCDIFNIVGFFYEKSFNKSSINKIKSQGNNYSLNSYCHYLPHIRVKKKLSKIKNAKRHLSHISLFCTFLL